MSDIQIRVMPAFLLRGSLKAVMPFEMASTPVRAVVPLEKACSSKKGGHGLGRVDHFQVRRVDHRAERAGNQAEDAPSDGHQHHHDEEIGGDGKSGARFFDPAQVDQHDKNDHAHSDLDTVRKELRISRDDLGHTRRDGNRHGEDVIGQQGGAGGLGGQLTQVIAGDDVGAAAVRDRRGWSARTRW